jgi:hypothetical protein
MAGVAQNLLIWTGAANNLQLATTSGYLSIGGSLATNAFTNITITNTATMNTSGSIYVRANQNITANSAVVTTGAMPVSLIAGNNPLLTGTLLLAANVTSAGGNILLDSGFAALAGNSSINQIAGLISSGGGTITAQSVSNITFSGAAISVNTGGGVLTVDSTTGTIAIEEDIVTGGGNATFTAGLDIDVNPNGSVATGAGNLTMNADNQILINGDATSLSTTTGDIVVIADADNSGFGDLLVQQNITSTMGGDVCLAAGPGTFGCSNQNCQSGFIGGFPAGSSTVNISAGTVSSTTGDINVVSAEHIIVNGASPSIQTAGAIALTAGFGDITVDQQILSTAGPITTFAGNNTILNQGAGPALIHAAGEIRMITGLNMVLNMDTAILSDSPGGQVTIIVDNIHPNQPIFPSAQSGSLTMMADSSITSGSPLRIFTAYSQAFLAGPGVNSIDPTALLNGMNPFALGYPGTPGQNTIYEQYCVFFGCANNYPSPNLGEPFTFFYKVCVQLLAQQANLIVSEQLEEFSTSRFFTDWGIDEYWGWPTKFYFVYELASTASLDGYRNHPPEPYFQRNRQFRLVYRPSMDFLKRD